MENNDLSAREREEFETGLPRLGSVAVVIGQILLLLDLFPLALSYMSIRDGSWFWVWWMVSMGAVGGILLVAGQRYRRRQVDKILANEQEAKTPYGRNDTGGSRAA